jgi:formylglycine-generating enzyme required for sulfatase activity
MAGLVGYAGLGTDDPAAPAPQTQAAFYNVNPYGMAIAGTAIKNGETITLSSYLDACNSVFTAALGASLIADKNAFIASLNAVIVHAYATPSDTQHNILAAVLSMHDGALPAAAPSLTGATGLCAEQVFILSTILAGSYIPAATIESAWKENALFRSQLLSSGAVLSAVPPNAKPLHTASGTVPQPVGAIKPGFGLAINVLASGLGAVVEQSLPNATSAVDQTVSIPVVHFSSARTTVPLQYSFDASGSTDPLDQLSALRFRWTFDVDGAPYRTAYSSAPAALYTFPAAGTYSVILEVANSQGIVSATNTQFAASPASQFQVGVTCDSAQGSVARAPDAAAYDSLAQVALIPFAKPGFRFAGWTGDIAGAVRSGDTLKVTVTSTMNITAVFSANPRYVLTVVADTALGAVARTPDAAAYDSGAVVKLVPQARTGWKFAGWAGDTAGGSRNADTLRVVMAAAKSVTASFRYLLPTYMLSVTVDTTQGTVAISPDSASYDSGVVVALLPKPKASHKFAGWSGDTAGARSNGDTLLLTMNAAKNVSAGFVHIIVPRYRLVVTFDSTRGTMLRIPGDTSYDSGTVVTIVPKPATGFKFAEWEHSPYGLALHGDTLTVTITHQAAYSGIFYPYGMSQIPGGTFTMGTNDPGVYGYSQASPAHSVTITSFFMDKTHVSQAEFRAVMGFLPQDTTNDSTYNIVNSGGVNRPVAVDWFNAVRYCIRKSVQEGLASCYDTTDPSNWKCDVTKSGYRLPTEAEWEYACKAGTTTAFYWGNGLDGNYVWYHSNSGDTMHIVGQKLPSAWGLYDMIGNDHQWTNDWFGGYDSTAQTDPAVATPFANIKAVRGAGSFSWAQYITTQVRFNFNPEAYGPGFRTVKR